MELDQTVEVTEGFFAGLKGQVIVRTGSGALIVRVKAPSSESADIKVSEAQVKAA